MNKTKAICYYLPQFHQIPENDKWWGRGYTEWTRSKKTRPLFKGHYQPHQPIAPLGYYNLLSPHVRNQQASMARKYGIYGFCYYYYWFHGKQLLQQPLEAMVKCGKPDFPFCICWANENWTRAWDGKDQALLMEQTYSPGDDIAFIRKLMPILKDPRYIKIGGRPVILIYRAENLLSPKKTIRMWRKECKRLGMGPPYVVAVHSYQCADPTTYKFDAAVEFPPHHVSKQPCPGISVKPIVHHYPLAVESSIRAQEKNLTLDGKPVRYPLFRGVMPQWDNTPRVGRAAHVFYNSSPQSYEKWLTKTVQFAESTLLEHERFVFINAWNEWGEGCHLEPDKKNGYKYLEATKNALSK